MRKDEIADTFPEAARAAVLGFLDGRQEAAINELLAAGISLNVAGQENWTLMFLAATSAMDAAIAELTKAGANPDGIPGRAPVHAAAGLRDPATLDLLLRLGAQPDGLSGEQPALVRAAGIPNAPAIELLVAAGAAIDLANGAGITPVIEAAAAGNWTTVLRLLELGANPWATSIPGSTLGSFAAAGLLRAGSVQETARQKVMKDLRERGSPWPLPNTPQVRQLRDAGQWPPPGVR